jgi:mannose-6-phosphate isomerase
MDPLRFRRHFVEKVWGGRALAECPGIALPIGPDGAEPPIGETWEIVDREDENSVVADGPFAGRTLRELMLEHADAILGDVAPAAGGRFPLLVKYIDARDRLSVQVHPDDASAERIGDGAEGKTEAWLILAVEGGAGLYAGLDPDMTPERYAAIADSAAGVDALARWDVRPGQCVSVPGGTVHAIGAGVTLLEVQQNSDTTYRLYDWDRVGLDGQPRATHVEQGLRAVRFGVEPSPPIEPTLEDVADGVRRAELARSPYFAIDDLHLRAPFALDTDGAFRIYAVLGGSGTLSARDGACRLPLNPGDVWLVPAACGPHTLAPQEGELHVAQLLARS